MKKKIIIKAVKNGCTNIFSQKNVRVNHGYQVHQSKDLNTMFFLKSDNIRTRLHIEHIYI